MSKWLVKKSESESAPKDEMEKWFEERTKRHIQLAQKYALRINEKFPEQFKELIDRVEKHDGSKFKEPERTPYISISWRHKQNNNKDFKKPGTLPNKEENEATLYHIRNNEHHPEFWNKEEANISDGDRDKSDTCLDATKMPDIAIAEMVADWCAMSEELNSNPKDWADKQLGVRWEFNEEQTDLIYELIDSVWETLNV